MLAKIIAFVLVYLLSIFNFFIFLSPLTFLLFSKLLLNLEVGENYTKAVFFLSISFVNFLMLLFLSFDFLFSYSVRKTKKGCKNCEKDKNYAALAEIFRNVKKKYNVKNVKLYVSPSSEINAYAVGGLRKNAIIVTAGLLNKYSSEDEENFLLSVEGILGHEMSHIVNNDYFTALLLIVNERAVNFASNIVLFIFNFFIRIVSFIPLVGRYLAFSLMAIYKIFNYVITFCYKYIVKPIYNFIQLQISKSIEYRADKQGAMVIGGENMSHALSILGNNGYFSIFSTHPLTKDRMRNVKNVESRERIRALFLPKILLILSLLLMLYLCYMSYEMANIDAVIYDFNTFKIYIYGRIEIIKNFLNNLHK